MDSKKINVGGQAVIEGVMMRSPRSFAVAVRRSDGSITVREEPWIPVMSKYRILRWPFFRGMVVLFEALYNGMSALYFSAEVVSEDLSRAEASKGSKESNSNSGKNDKSLGTWALVGTMIFSFALAILLFKFLPHLLTIGVSYVTGTQIPINGIEFHIIDGVIKIAIFLGYIWAVSFLPDMRRVFAYHGAEHKSIACYEAGLPLTVENARIQSRFHPRCGTSFIVIVLLVAIILFAVVFRFLPPLSDNKFLNVFLQMFIKVPLMLPVAGIAYEFIRFAGKPDSPSWARWLSAPGLWTQRLTTKEPDDSMLEVAIVSIKATLAREKALDASGEDAISNNERRVFTIGSAEEVSC